MTRKGPILIDLEPNEAPNPAEAPPILDDDVPPQGAAMQQLAALSVRRRSPLLKWFFGLLASLIGFIISLAAWDYVTSLLDRSPVLGLIATVLIGAVLLLLALLALKEIWALSRMKRLDRVHQAAMDAAASHDLKAAKDVVAQVEALYAHRADMKWGLQTLKERKDEVLDADGLLGLAETSLLLPLDQRARAEVEAASRQVAAVTAIVPLALADVFTALSANLRMIRRIAEIYGGRSGTLGSWRLTRSVLSHLVATGAVAVGDDLIGTVAGGGALTKVSRRFGEGVVNGALTARVGLAALEVCRPLPYVVAQKPTVSGLVGRSLTGLFGRNSAS